MVTIIYTFYKIFLPVILRNYEGKNFFGDESLETLNICLMFFGILTTYGPNLLMLNLGIYDMHRRNFLLE